MIMNFTKALWEKAHWLTRIPGVYRAYLGLTNKLYPDGKIVQIKRGPLTGLKWQRFRCHQAWMAMGMYEPHVAQLISEILQPGDVFYDIGANAGYFTLIAAQRVSPTGKVIAFEPVPFNVDTIQNQINMNGFETYCKVEALAISNYQGDASFIVPTRNANAHLADIYAPNVQEQGKKIDVKTTTIDQYIQNHSLPTLIKIDIEGAEVVALEGASKFLSSPNAPVLLVSTHSQQLDNDVKKILANYGYEIINLAGFKQMVYARPK